MLKKTYQVTPSKGVILFFILCVTLITFPAIPVKARAPLVLAKIDGKKITTQNFTQYLNLFDDNPAYQARTLEDKKRLLNYLIDRTLLLEAAQEEGYAKRDKIKKHPFLGKIEDETMILRAYLIDHVSHKVSVTQSDAKTYQKNHPGLTLKQARDEFTTQRQEKTFHALIAHLRKGHTIKIYTENLERYRKPTP